MHGLEGYKDSEKWQSIASGLSKEGYACLRFNFKGCGEGEERSEGNFEDVTLTARIKDYEAAVDFLYNLGKVNVSRLGAVGSSFGGMVAIAATHVKMKAIAVMGTPYKLPRYDRPIIPRKEGEYYVLPSGRRFKEKFYEDVKKYDLLQAVKRAPPILILHGGFDEVVPLEHAYKLYEAASEPKRIEIIEEADHVFSRGLDKAIELILEWFKKYL